MGLIGIIWILFIGIAAIAVVKMLTNIFTFANSDALFWTFFGIMFAFMIAGLFIVGIGPVKD